MIRAQRSPRRRARIAATATALLLALVTLVAPITAAPAANAAVPTANGADAADVDTATTTASAAPAPSATAESAPASTSAAEPATGDAPAESPAPAATPAPSATPAPAAAAAPTSAPVPAATPAATEPASPAPTAVSPAPAARSTTSGGVSLMAVGAEPTVDAPYISWSVADGGTLVAGATFEVLRSQQERRWLFGWGAFSAYQRISLPTDCTTASCASSGDRDPDSGEFQITEGVLLNTQNVRYRYQIVPTTPPSGTSWQSTAAVETAVAQWNGDTFDAGRFEVGRNLAVSCVSGTFYSLSTDGAVNQVVRSGSSATITEFGRFTGVGSNAQMNAFGIGLGGSTMYAAERPSSSSNGISAIHRYSVAQGWQRTAVSGSATDINAVLGAVNFADGRYYFGGFRTSGSTTSFQLYVFDPATSAVTARGSFVASMSGTSNGDFAFDVAGNLYVVQNLSNGQSRVYTVAAAAVNAGGTMPATSSAPFSGLSGVNGAAFEGDGTFYLGTSTTVVVYDSSTGGLRPGNVTTALSNSGDLASCLSPATLTVRKDVLGRVASGDQFTLSAVRGSTSLGSATTSGTATGLQAAQVGPVPALSGQTYTVQETISANAGSYASSYACIDDRGATVASGSGRSGSITMPERVGANVVCTFRNAPLVTEIVVRKLVDAGDGAEAAPRQGWAVSAATSAQRGTVTATPTASSQITGADGAARWNLRFGSSDALATVAIAETQRAGFEFLAGECVVTPLTGSPSEVELTGASGTTLRDIAPGSSVECVFVNKVKPTTLTLVKQVTFGTASTNLFTLTATAPSGALAGPTGISGAAATTNARITPAVAYRLSESGGPATYAQAGSWTCVNQSGAAVAVTTTSDVTAAQGDSVTCTVRNATANLVILERIENTTQITADQFTLTSTPTALAGLQATTVTGSEAVASANTIQVRPGHSYALDSTSSAASIGLRFERYVGPAVTSGPIVHTNASYWVAADPAAVSVASGQTGIYRFVATYPTPFSLPVTGGIGADQIQLLGAGIAALALMTGLGLLLHRRRRAA